MFRYFAAHDMNVGFRPSLTEVSAHTSLKERRSRGGAGAHPGPEGGPQKQRGGVEAGGRPGAETLALPRRGPALDRFDTGGNAGRVPAGQLPAPGPSTYPSFPTALVTQQPLAM